MDSLAVPEIVNNKQNGGTIIVATLLTNGMSLALHHVTVGTA